MTEKLVRELLDTEGVTSVTVQKTVKVTHKKELTGETDDTFQSIRERVIPKEKFEAIGREHNWRYHGTVDVMGDFNLKDKFTKTEDY